MAANENIQRAIAIPEPTNDPDSLWRTAQALKEAVEVAQGIRGNREAALKCDLDDVGNTVSTIISGGIPGITSLFDLSDTDVIGQAQYDLIFNADGTEWQNTAGELIWNPTLDYLQLANAHSINWLDTLSASVELLQFESTAAAGVTPDPDIGNVVVLFDGEGADGATTTTDLVNGHVATAVTVGAATVEIDTAQSKFGSSSMFFNVAAGSTDGSFVIPDDDAFDLGSGDFTFEAHVRFKSLLSGFVIFSKWVFPNQSWTFSLPAAAAQIGFSGSTNGSNSISAPSQAFSTASVVDVWYHFAWVRSGNNFYYFRDGIQAGTTQTFSNTLFSSTQAVEIGNENNGNFNADFWIDNARLTQGVARYTSNFTPPTAPYDDGGVETFVVGDPAFPTKIEGLSTNITSASTDIDGSLNVDGAATLNGNVELLAGADLRLRSGGVFQIYDAGDTDHADFSHDGTDFNTLFVNTLDWNLFNGVRFKLWDSSGADSFYLTETGSESQLVASTNDIALYPQFDTASLRVANFSGTKFELEGDQDIRSGNGLRLYDSLNTASSLEYHDGTDFNTTFTSTIDWLITGLSGGEVNIDGSLSVQGDVNINPPSILSLGSRIGDVIELWGAGGSLDPSGNSYIAIESGKVVFNTATGAQFEFRQNNVNALIVDFGVVSAQYTLTTTDSIQAFGPIQDQFASTTAEMFYAGLVGADVHFGGYRWDTDVYVPTQVHGNPIGLYYNTTLMLNIPNGSGIDITGTTTSTRGYSAGSTIQNVGQPGPFAFMDFSGGIGRFGAFDYFGGFIWQPSTITGSTVDIDARSVSLLLSGNSGLLTVTSGNTDFFIQKAGAGNYATVSFNNELGVVKWRVGESSLTTDDDFDIDRYSDAGAYLSTPFLIESATGYILMRSRLKIANSGNTDWAAFDHDGIDFNTDFVNTTDWNITGITGLNIQDGTFLTMWDSTNADFAQFQHNGSHFSIVTGGTGGGDIQVTADGGQVDLLSGTGLRIRDSGDVDWAEMSHDGTDFSIITAGAGGGNININPAGSQVVLITGTELVFQDFTGARTVSFNAGGFQLNTDFAGGLISWGIDGLTTMEVLAGAEFKVWDTLDFNSIRLAHDGTDAILESVGIGGPNNGGDIHLVPGGGQVDLMGGAGLRIRDSADTSWSLSSHDGTDFNTAFTSTTDWNITGATAIVHAGAYEVLDAAGPTMVNEAATSINPTLIPNITDLDTGLGWASANQVSMVAGAIEAIRYSTASSHVLADSETHTGITAGTTQTQAGGFQLLSSHNEVGTVANTNDTVVAPLASAGRVLTILNNGANTLQIFPAVGDDIGAGVDTVITLAAAGKLWFVSYDATTWTQFV